MICSYDNFVKDNFSSNFPLMGSGCGTVDGAVASNTRRPQIKSSQPQNFIKNIFTLIVEKTEIKEKEAVNGEYFLTKLSPDLILCA